jgi:hypothetical protein
MTVHATLVQRPAVRLVACRAESFPDGIKAAWDRLESRLASLKQRRFYGLTYLEADGLAYYACVEPIDEAEIAALGFPVLTLAGGTYARVKLPNWQEHAGEIGGIFEQLMANHRKTPGGPTVEYYRSQSELHLLIPVAEDES